MDTADYFSSPSDDLLSANTAPIATQSLPVVQGEQQIAVDQPPVAPPPRYPQPDRGYAMPLEPVPEAAFNYGPGPMGTSDTGLPLKPTALPLVIAAGAGVAGGIFGGLYGAGAGLLLTGAAVNTYRLVSNKDQERSAHAVFAVAAAVAGGWMAYKAFGKKATQQ